MEHRPASGNAAGSLRNMAYTDRTLGKAVMTDMNLAREIHVDYPLAAAKAFDTAFGAKMPAGKKFRFIFCSGVLAERDQNKSLWMAGEYRRIRVCLPIVDGSD